MLGESHAAKQSRVREVRNKMKRSPLQNGDLFRFLSFYSISPIEISLPGGPLTTQGISQ